MTTIILMLLMQLFSFCNNKDPLPISYTGGSKKHCDSGVNFSVTKSLWRDREGISWISFQYDENDNGSATCAKDKSSFIGFDFKKHNLDEWVRHFRVTLSFILHFQCFESWNILILFD